MYTLYYKLFKKPFCDMELRFCGYLGLNFYSVLLVYSNISLLLSFIKESTFTQRIYVFCSRNRWMQDLWHMRKYFWRIVMFINTTLSRSISSRKHSGQFKGHLYVHKLGQVKGNLGQFRINPECNYCYKLNQLSNVGNLVDLW